MMSKREGKPTFLSEYASHLELRATGFGFMPGDREQSEKISNSKTYILIF